MKIIKQKLSNPDREPFLKEDSGAKEKTLFFCGSGKSHFGNFLKSGLIVLISVLIIHGVAQAGTITPPSGAGEPSAKFYTFSEIYTRLTTNATATAGGHSFNFSDALTGTGRTLTEIYNAIPTIIADTVKLGTTYLGKAGTLVPLGGDATAANVLIDKTFFGASQTDWNTKTGTMVNNGAFALTAGSSDQSVATGYYSGGTLSGDANLVTGNILSGKTIFGVSGKTEVVDTTEAAVPIAVGTVLANKAGYVNGIKIIGTMVDRAATSYTPSNVAQTIVAGYYNGSGTVATDADLIEGNIANGINIFGVIGNLVAGYLYGDSDASKVLTSATGNGGVGSYLATNLNDNTVKKGVSYGVGPTTGLLFGDVDASKVLTIADGGGAAKGTYNVTNLSNSVIKSGTTWGVDLGSTGAFKSLLPDTGQTGCWDAAGTAITCGNAPAGQDAEYTFSNSATCAPSYTDNANGTITDNCTNLIWKKCSEGMTYNTGTGACDGAASTYTWANALGQCEGLTYPAGSYADWRLPNIKELPSIADYQNVNPAINTTAFPSTVSGYYWSSATYGGSPSYAWYVSFHDGGVSGNLKTSNGYARCVRGQ